MSTFEKNSNEKGLREKSPLLELSRRKIDHYKKSFTKWNNLKHFAQSKDYFFSLQVLIFKLKGKDCLKNETCSVNFITQS